MSITLVPVSTYEEQHEISSRLSYFGATGSTNYVNGLIEHLILHTLADLPPGSHSTKEILKKLTGTVRIPLHFEQVLAALRRLATKETVYSVNPEYDETAKFGLPVEDISRLRRERKSYDESERKVIQDWLDEVRAHHPTLTSADLDALSEDLQLFSAKLYSLHSIESVSLYFGDSESVSKLMENLEVQNLESILPERRSDLNRIRMQELVRFFRNAPIERKEYIGKQLNPSFMLHMMQLDPTCAAFASKQISGGTLFLDTNFIYRVVGLSGPDLQNAALTVLKLSKGLGYNTVVSPRTIEEYKYSIEKFVGRARDLPKISPEVAKAALSTTVQDDFYTHYWQRSVDAQGYLSAEGYLQMYSHIEILLKEYGVLVDDEYDKYIRTHDPELAAEESLLQSTLPEWKPPHDRILQHDAHHRLLILMLRAGHEEISPLETPYWFLTCDTKLPVYDRRARPRQKLKVPYCVLSSNWLQLLLPFCGAVEGFEVIQASALESSLFRLFSSPNSETIQEIITRMSVSKNLPPKAVAKIVVNDQFVRTFSQQKTEEQREQVFQDFFYGEFVENLESETLAIKSELENLNQKYSELEKSAQVSKQERDAILAEKEALRGQIRDLESEMVVIKRTDIVGKESAITSIKTLLDSPQPDAQLPSPEQPSQDSRFEEFELKQTRILRFQQKFQSILFLWTIVLLVVFVGKTFEIPVRGQAITLCLILIATVITQVIALYKSAPNLVGLGILVVVDILATSISALGIFGVSISDSFNILVGLGSVAGAVFAALQFYQNRPS